MSTPEDGSSSGSSGRPAGLWPWRGGRRLQGAGAAASVPGAVRGSMPERGPLGDLARELRRWPGQVADLFVLAARRLWANRRLLIGLQVGVIVAATVAATVPLYSNGALMRLLASELQPQNDRPSGAVMLRYVYHQGDNYTPAVQARLQQLAGSVDRRAGIPGSPVYFYEATATRSLLPDPASAVPEDPSVARSGWLEAEAGFHAHVTILAGHMYAQNPEPDGTIEAIISRATQQSLQMVVGQTYELTEPGLANHLNIKIVGIYRRLNPTGDFWPFQFETANLVISPVAFAGVEAAGQLPLSEVTWYQVLHLSQLAPSGALSLSNTLENINSQAGQIMAHADLAVSPLKELQAYAARLSSMQSELLLISLPILVLTLYYVVMTSGLAIQQERNEIAVLVSRGARTWQVISLYVAEWVIMGVVAIVVAPFPAAFLTELVGSSSGFLVFVNRQPLAIVPTASMYEFEITAAAVALLAAMFPVFEATRQSVLGYKQEVARLMRAPFWRRAYVDFILGAIAFYEWRQFHVTFGAATTATGAGFAVQPLLYLVPALFIAAAGLFLVRILPYIIRAVDALIGRVAPLQLVLPARQLARTPAQFSPLIFLLVFTVALGFYSASAARTLNRNLSDQLSYQVGSDVSLYEVWAPQGVALLGDSAAVAGLESAGAATPAAGLGSGTAAAPAAGLAPGAAAAPAAGLGSGTGAAPSAGASGTSSSGTASGPPQLQQFGGVTQAVGLAPGQTQAVSAYATGQAVAEPPFAPNLSLPGVISAARVFLEPAQIVIGGRALPGNGQLMAIEPSQFYQTAWWRNDLSPYTFAAYMTSLAQHYNGVLVSQSFLASHALSPGDSVVLQLAQGQGSFEVLGPIQNWPGVYATNGPIFVANWSYVEHTFGVLPYYVWFKTKPSASVATMEQDLTKSKLFATQLVDRRVLLGQAHANPQRTGSDGLLTIGFLVASLLTVLGYLLYAVLAMRNRMLQFGLLRAMGLPRPSLSMAVALEQVFLLGVGIAGGLYVGDWASGLFLPFFQASNGGSVPPFLISGPGPDLSRMGAILAVLLAFAIAGLLQVLRGMRIGEAVKLGED